MFDWKTIMVIFSKHTQINLPLATFTHMHSHIHTYMRTLTCPHMQPQPPPKVLPGCTPDPSVWEPQRADSSLQCPQYPTDFKANQKHLWRQHTSTMQSTVIMQPCNARVIKWGLLFLQLFSSDKQTVALVCITWRERQERAAQHPWQTDCWLGAQPWVELYFAQRAAKDGWCVW